MQDDKVINNLLEYENQLLSQENAILKSALRVSGFPKFENLGNETAMYEMNDGRKMYVSKVTPFNGGRTMYRISADGRGDALFTIDELFAIDHLCRYTMNDIDLLCEKTQEG